MARTEFHDQSVPDPDETKYFEQQKVSTLRESSFMTIDVVQYKGEVKLDGIFGRRIVSTDTVREMMNALQDALDFIEENPPRKEFR